MLGCYWLAHPSPDVLTRCSRGKGRVLASLSVERASKESQTATRRREGKLRKLDPFWPRCPFFFFLLRRRLHSSTSTFFPLFSTNSPPKKNSPSHHETTIRPQKHQVKKAIEKGNIDGAKIYAQNAIRKKTEALNYLRLASRLDAVVSRLETQAKMQGVARSMGGIVKALDRALATNNIEKVAETMDAFERQFEDLDVQSQVMEGAMSAQASLATPEEDVATLLQQVADEHGLEVQLNLPQAGAQVRCCCWGGELFFLERASERGGGGRGGGVLVGWLVSLFVSFWVFFFFSSLTKPLSLYSSFPKKRRSPPRLRQPRRAQSRTSPRGSRSSAGALPSRGARVEFPLLLLLLLLLSSVVKGGCKKIKKPSTSLAPLLLTN